MHKSLCTLAVLLCTQVAISQSSKTELTIVSGVNFSIIPGLSDNVQNPSSKGYRVGMDVSLRLNHAIRISGGLLVERYAGVSQPVILSDQFGGEIFNTRILNMFTSLSLPVNIEYRIGNSQRLRLAAGGFAGYLLKQTKTIHPIDGAPTPEQPVVTVNKAYGTPRLNAGLQLGVHYIFPLNKNVGLRFNISDHLGLVNLLNSIPMAFMKTNVLSASTGLVMRIR